VAVADTAPDPFETLKTRAQTWLAPIPGAAPAGVTAKLDVAYQAVANEVGKLDTPAGGEVDWKKVAAGAGELLERRTKDFTLAAYLARALQAIDGFEGLGTGLTVYGGLLDTYWENAFPEVKRLRGRANATQWLVEKTAAGLQQWLDRAEAPGQGVKVRASDVTALQATEAAAQRLAEVVRAKLGDAAPAMGPLLEVVQRAKATAEQILPPAPPPQAAPSATPTASTAEAQPVAPATPGQPQPQPQAQPTATRSAPAPALDVPAVTAPASVEGATEYLRDAGTAIASVGAALRRADLTDPAAYRVLRAGLWLHLAHPPPATGGKTSIPPPPDSLRASLGLMLQNQRWAALLEEAESALQQHRLWLDLHRMSAQALAALGGAHARAGEALASEVRGLLARMPPLPSLTFNDGTPLADAQTKTWLQESVAPKPAARGGGDAGGDDLPAEPVAEARKLLAAGQIAEGLAALQALVMSRPAGRARFKARLLLAQAAAGAGLQPVALATFEELDRESLAHRLDAWEPTLAAECLKGLVAASRALAQDPRGTSPELASKYQRLCRLDPAAAHEVWP
jgi:type VI secretion system protein VasJ